MSLSKKRRQLWASASWYLGAPVLAGIWSFPAFRFAHPLLTSRITPPSPIDASPPFASGEYRSAISVSFPSIVGRLRRTCSTRRIVSASAKETATKCRPTSSLCSCPLDTRPCKAAIPTEPPLVVSFEVVVEVEASPDVFPRNVFNWASSASHSPSVAGRSVSSAMAPLRSSALSVVAKDAAEDEASSSPWASIPRLFNTDICSAGQMGGGTSPFSASTGRRAAAEGAHSITTTTFLSRRSPRHRRL